MEPYLIPLVIVAVVAGSTTIVELLSWLIVYRTAGYKRIISEITAINHKFAVINKGPQAEKDIPKKKKKLEAELMALTRDFTLRIRGVTGVLSLVSMITVYRFVSTQFGGIPVGKLPFHPPKFLTRMTHGGLEGEDFLDFSATFVYMLCGLSVRANIGKFLQLGPSRAVAYTASPQYIMQAMEKNAQ